MADIKDICLCVLCGLPGAGKSTFCKHLMQSRSTDFEFLLICFDRLIPWINFSLPDALSTWKQYRCEVLLLVKYLVNILLGKDPSTDFLSELSLISKDHAFLLHDLAEIYQKKEQCSVIFLIDDNMPYRKMRHEYFQLARTFNIGFCTIMVDCPIQVCKKRNEARPIEEVVKMNSIKRINAQMERPDIIKAKWEKYNYIFELQDQEIDIHLPKAIELMQLAMDNPVASLPQPNESLSEELRTKNRNNVRHQADLYLRKLSNEFMQQQSEPEQFVETVSFAKKSILGEIRSGQIDEQDYITDTGEVDHERLAAKMRVYFKTFVEM